MTPTLRPYAGPADLRRLDAVRAAARAVDGDRWWPGPAEGHGPTDRCVLAEVDGTVVGFGWALWWTETTGTRVCLLTGCVAPQHRRRGVGTALLRRQEELAALEADGPTELGANADEDQPGASALLLAHGYAVALTMAEMACTPVRTATAPPAGLTIRQVDDADHPLVHAALEECFADASHIPRTYEEYLSDVQDVDLWWSAWHGDELAGLVINERRSDGTVVTPWVAVRPAFRRRGVAQAMLRTTLSALADLGVPRATLMTAKENRHGTIALYGRLGYRVIATHPRYRKTLLPATRGQGLA